MSDDVIASARENQVVNYSNVATFTFLAWELCVVFPDEINFIWSGTRSWSIKLAYILLRYYALVVTFLIQNTGTGLLEYESLNIYASHCLARYKYQIASLQIVIALQQFIMASRVYALYRRSLAMAIVLATSFIIEHALIGTFTVLTVPSIAYNDVCIATEISSTVFGMGLPPILYDLLLLVLTIYKCIETAPLSWRQTPLIWALVRDGSWAFAVVLGVICINFLFLFAFHSPMASVALSWQYASASFASCRIVLHMHREAAKSSSPGMRSRSPSSSSHTRPCGQDRNGASVETEGFALTTFLPGMEFEESELPDKWGGEA